MKYRHIHVAGLLAFGVWLSLLSINAGMSETDSTLNAVTISNRSLIDTLDNIDQAVVTESPLGWKVEFFTDEQVNANGKEVSSHNQRHRDYITKWELLNKRRQALEKQAPKAALSAGPIYEKALSQSDSNGNGVIEVSERETYKHMDVNQDGIVTLAELVHIGMRHPKEQLPTLATINGWLAEQTAINELESKLKRDFSDVRKSRSNPQYYRVIEIAPEFIRLQSESEERTLPMSSIQEFRRMLDVAG